MDYKEMSNTKDELNTSDDGQIITFGSPQLGMEEICKITCTNGRKKVYKTL